MKITRWNLFTKKEFTLLMPLHPDDIQTDEATGQCGPAPSAFQKEGGAPFVEAEDPDDIEKSVHTACMQLMESGFPLTPEHVFLPMDQAMFQAMAKTGARFTLQQNADEPWRIRMINKTPRVWPLPKDMADPAKERQTIKGILIGRINDEDQGTFFYGLIKKDGEVSWLWGPAPHAAHRFPSVQDAEAAILSMRIEGPEDRQPQIFTDPEFGEIPESTIEIGEIMQEARKHGEPMDMELGANLVEYTHKGGGEPQEN